MKLSKRITLLTDTIKDNEDRINNKEGIIKHSMKLQLNNH